MNYSLFKFLTILLMLMGKGLDAKKKIFNIFWNTTNPMFRIDNTDNVIDINKDNLPWEYDQANIICPSYPRGTREADIERYMVYSVSRSEYENCRIITPNPKVVTVCDSPHKLSYVTITFRSFSPIPGSLEFKPGHDYFFISTSSRTDLHRRVGGRCSTNNMKIMFKVAPEPDNDVSATVNVPRNYDSFEQPKIKEEPIYEDVFSEIDSNSVEQHKRSEDYDVLNASQRRHSNGEVVKQASVMQHNNSCGTTVVNLTFVVVIAFVNIWISRSFPIR